jgi:predicted MPP superfamily phosphohydrolase
MLKNLFGSGARVKLLEQFLNNQNSAFFIRELTRILDEQINSLRRELENLEKIGLLKSKEKNRKKYYQINPHFSFLSELTSIFKKSSKENEELLKKTAKLGKFDILILTGKFIENGEKSLVDIFLVGEIKETEIKKIVEDIFPGKEDLKCGAINREEFLYRVEIKDKFITDLFANKNNIIIKNKLKKDTVHLIK